MAVSLDDQARLPPMIPHDKVLERQSEEDLRAYRQYLVDTGSIKCLVKLYKHVVKKEMRMDNPVALRDFLSVYADEAPETKERLVLSRENETLRDANSTAEAEILQLKEEIREAERQSVGKALWRHITAAEFWEGRPGGEGVHSGADLTLDQLWRRMVGETVDPPTGFVLVDIMRPASLPPQGMGVVAKKAFCDWVAQFQLDEPRESEQEFEYVTVNRLQVPIHSEAYLEKIGESHIEERIRENPLCEFALLLRDALGAEVVGDFEGLSDDDLHQWIVDVQAEHLEPLRGDETTMTQIVSLPARVNSPQQILQRFMASAPNEAPYEENLVQAIYTSGLYPDEESLRNPGKYPTHLHEVPEVISLQSSLLTFLEDAAIQFRDAPGQMACEPDE